MDKVQKEEAPIAKKKPDTQPPAGDTKIKKDVIRETKEEVSRAVKKSKNPLSAVPERLLNKRTLNFKVPSAKVFDVKVNSACQVITLSTFDIKTEQLDLGDLIKEVNGTEITAKSQLNSFLEKLATDSKTEYEVNIIFLRVVRTEPIPLNSPLIPAAVDLQLGFAYLEGHMLLLPRGSLGLKIKTYNNKVYVTSTDNGFNCVSKRTLLVGDAILSVDQKPVSMLKECSQMLTSCLEKKGFVSVVIERPDSALVAPLVRAALIAEKNVDADPRMADDVIAICKEEIARMVKKQKPEARPILRTAKSERNKNPIKLGDKESTEVVIDMDPINPVLLRHVPPQVSEKDSSDKSNTNQKAVGCNHNSKYTTISKTRRLNLKQPRKV